MHYNNITMLEHIKFNDIYGLKVTNVGELNPLWLSLKLYNNTEFSNLSDEACFALIGWILIMVLLHQLSYAIKTQLRVTQSPLLMA